MLTGLYADCMPPAGMSDQSSCLVCVSMLIPLTAFSTGLDNFILEILVFNLQSLKDASQVCTAGVGIRFKPIFNVNHSLDELVPEGRTGELLG